MEASKLKPGHVGIRRDDKLVILAGQSEGIVICPCHMNVGFTQPLTNYSGEFDDLGWIDYDPPFTTVEIANRTVQVDHNGVSGPDFSISREKVKEIYQLVFPD